MYFRITAKLGLYTLLIIHSVLSKIISYKQLNKTKHQVVGLYLGRYTKYILLCIIVLFSAYLLQEKIFNVLSSGNLELELLGDTKYINKNILSEKLKPHLLNGIVSAELETIKANLKEDPWLKDITLRKAWPKKIKVVVKEYEPFAYWDKDYVLTTDGNLIKVSFEDSLKSYPHFIADNNKVNNLVSLYEILGKKIPDTSLKIKVLELDELDAVSVTFNNGIKLYLGSDEVQKRFERSLLMYIEIERNEKRKIVYLDARYQNGIAVSFTKG